MKKIQMSIVVLIVITLLASVPTANAQGFLNGSSWTGINSIFDASGYGFLKNATPICSGAAYCIDNITGTPRAINGTTQNTDYSGTAKSVIDSVFSGYSGVIKLSGTFNYNGAALSTIHSDITIEGDTSTVIRIDDSSNNKLIADTSSGSNIIFRNFVIDGNGDNQNDGAVRGDRQVINLKNKINVVFENMILKNARDGNVLSFSNITTLKLLNNRILDNGKGGAFAADGVWINSSTDILIQGNTVKTCTDVGTALDNSNNIRLIGNNFSGCVAAFTFYQSTETPTSHDMIVEGNNVDQDGETYSFYTGRANTSWAPPYGITISNNHFKGSTGYMAATNDISILGNYFNGSGISFANAGFVDISGSNRFTDSDIAINFITSTSNRVIIHDNYFWNVTTKVNDTITTPSNYVKYQNYGISPFYHGKRSSDPTPFAAGDWYSNDTIDTFEYYTGSAWDQALMASKILGITGTTITNYDNGSVGVSSSTHNTTYANASGQVTFTNGTNNLAVGENTTAFMNTAGVFTQLRGRSSSGACTCNITMTNADTNAYIGSMWLTAEVSNSTNISSSFNWGVDVKMEITENTDCKQVRLTPIWIKTG